MTFGQMQALFYQRIDQSGSPDFTPTETDRLLNWGYDVWYIINRKKFDTDQTNTVNMTGLIRPFVFANVSNITVTGMSNTGQAAMIFDYRDLATLKAKFNFTDCNGVITAKWKNVQPIPLSAKDINLYQDPYNQPTDEYPMYVQSNTGDVSITGIQRVISILSTTVPLSVQGEYFKTLQIIDCEFNPNTDFELQDYVARQVIDITKIIAKGDLDDYPAVKNAVQETSMVLT